MKLLNDLDYLPMSHIICPMELRTLLMGLLCYKGMLGQLLRFSDFNVFVE